MHLSPLFYKCEDRVNGAICILKKHGKQKHNVNSDCLWMVGIMHDLFLLSNFLHHLGLWGPQNLAVTCLSSHSAHSYPPWGHAAFSWNTSGIYHTGWNLPQGPCLSFPSAQDPDFPMTASCQARLSSDDSFFRETFPTNPPSTHQSPPVTALLVLKISLLCICLLPDFPTVSTYTSQEVRPQLFLFPVVFLEPGKFLEPNGHLNKDLLQMD